MEELTPTERAAVELLRSNDPLAVERLVALDDSSRVRVLRALASLTPDGTTSDDSDARTDAAARTVEAEGPPPQPLPAAAAPANSVNGSDEASAATKPIQLLSVLRGALGSTGIKAALAAVGVALILVIILAVRGCGDDVGGTSDALLLVRASSDDLYVGQAGREISRDHRVVQDLRQLGWIRVAREGTWTSVHLADIAGAQVLVASTEDGDGAWVIDDLEYEDLVSGGESVTAIVAGETLYLREERDGAQRCYRGSAGELDDFERVFRGDYCSVARSGHIMGADGSDDSYRVRVWSPQGGADPVLRASFETRPEITENGLFLVGTDAQGVSVSIVESGDRVWSLDGSVGYDLASHPDGHIALAIRAEDDSVLLVLIERDGNVEELAEIDVGSITVEFAESGDLFWIETTDENDSYLSVWVIADRELVELADDEGLRLAGVYKDSAVTITEDDFGALFRSFSLGDPSEVELHELADDVVQSTFIDDGFLYVVGVEKASIVPLTGGEPIDSDPWDGIVIHDYFNGTLVAAGIDGSSEILFSISAGSDDDVEYGQYDEIVSAQFYGNTLYASIRDGSNVDTLAYNLRSGDSLESDKEYQGYYLLNNRERTSRSRMTAAGNASPAPAIEAPELERGEDEAFSPPATPARSPVLDASDGAYFADAHAARWVDFHAITNEGISRGGEVDSYVFGVATRQPVLMETFGQTDVTMDLYELSKTSGATQLAFDDDSADGGNSRLQLTLHPGWYLVVIRGYDGVTTGDYDLYVGN